MNSIITMLLFARQAPSSREITEAKADDLTVEDAEPEGEDDPKESQMRLKSNSRPKGKKRQPEEGEYIKQLHQPEYKTEL